MDGNQNILLNLEERESEELVLLLQGYYRLLTNRPLPVQQDRDQWTDDSAPPYHTCHTVQAVGWNYASETSVESGGEGGGREHQSVVERTTTTTTDQNFTTTTTTSDQQHKCVDLACSPPPYHHQNKCVTANGHVATGILVGTTADAVDRNMNKTCCRDDEDNDCQSLVRGRRQTVNGAYDCHVVAMEVKDSYAGAASTVSRVAVVPPASPPATKTSRTSDEAIRRVAEMQQMVFDAEMYLTEEEGTDTDHESLSRGESVHGDMEVVPKLKAADSLLLLTQVGTGRDHDDDDDLSEAVKNIALVVAAAASSDNNDPPSESDTDSMSTPTDSPSHHNNRRRQSQHQQHPVVGRCGSSFGLHSPPEAANSTATSGVGGGGGGGTSSSNLQELLQRLQMPYPFAEGTLYLDPDIIDLTMIPPPITPDHEEAPSLVSFPPTPFADRQCLEAELALLGTLPPPSCCRATKFLRGGPHAFDRTLLPPPPPSPDHLVASGKQDDDNEQDQEDLESFLASVAVPPPPSPTPFDAIPMQQELLTQEQISAFIIPPPPLSNSSSSSESSDTLVVGGVQEEEEEEAAVQKDRSLNEVLVRSLDDQGERPAANGVVDYSSSGYDTYASSSAVSSMDLRPQQQLRRHMLNNSFSDNSSTVSCCSSGGSSSSTQEADTEDNDRGSPLLGGLLDHHRPPSLLLASRKSSAAVGRPNGVLRSTTTTVDAATHLLLVRRSSSSSDDAHTKMAAAASAETCKPSGSQLRQLLVARKSPRTATSVAPSAASPPPLRLLRNRSSSTDSSGRNHHQQHLDEQLSASIENLTTAAATVASVRRTLSFRSPAVVDHSRSSNNCQKNVITTTNSNISRQRSAVADTGTILKSPAGMALLRSAGNNKAAAATSGGNVLSLQQEQGNKWTETRTLQTERVASDRGSRGNKPRPPRRVTAEVCQQRRTEDNVSVVELGGDDDDDQSPAKCNGRFPVTVISVRHLPSKLPRSASSSAATKTNESSPKPLPRKRHNINNNNRNVVASTNSLTSPEVANRHQQQRQMFLGAEPCSRERRDSFYGAEEAISNMLVRLDNVLLAGGGRREVVATRDEEEDSAAAAKESLVSASKRFVTASKQLVKGATESEDRLVECLSLCLALMDQMFVGTERLASSSCDLVMKVKDVALTFLQTLQAASCAVVDSSELATLMQQATALAAVLTALMRTLKGLNL